MWQHTPYTLPLVVAMFVGCLSAYVTWRQRTGRLELWGALSQLCVAAWAGFLLLTVSSVSLSWKLFWYLLFLTIVPWSALAALCFALCYTGREGWPTRSKLGVLFGIPLALVVIVFTSGSQEYVFTGAALDTSGTFVSLRYSWGPVFYVIAVYTYLVIVSYLTLLFLHCLRSRNVYRKISALLFTSLLLLNLGTVASILNYSPFPHFMLLPFSYIVLGVVIVLGTSSMKFVRLIPVDRLLSLFGSRFGSLVPLARDFIVEEIDTGVVVLDASKRVVDINTTGKKMIGADRPIGKYLDGVITNEKVITAGSFRGIVAGTAELAELRDEIWVRTSNGERCYDVNLSTLTSRNERLTGYVILLHDITQQKRREERLELREQELERQKESLVLQKAQLEHQNERLERFASIVSHDLRNPLNVAQGYIETIDANLNDAAAASADLPMDPAHLKEVATSHERMETIIEDALTLARQGKAITETEEIVLEALVSDAWTNVETSAAVLEVDADLSIEGDSDRLLNVFENLFRNATEHAGPEATVHVGSLENGFYVEDNGPGIPDDVKTDVLEQGYTTNQDGTGLGLSIVSDIIRAHGWAITVTDGDDGGARFEITGINARPSVEEIPQ